MPQRIVILQKKVTNSVSKDRRLPRVAQYPAEQMVHDEEEDAAKTSCTGPTSGALTVFQCGHESSLGSHSNPSRHVVPLLPFSRLED